MIKIQPIRAKHRWTSTNESGERLLSTYLTLELAEQQADHHKEGEAGEAGQDDEDGLLQPGGRAGAAVAAALVTQRVLTVVET